MRDAVLIGIDSYTEAPLQGCVNDAKQMAECLSLSEYNFHCRELYNQAATRSAILEELFELTDLDDEISDDSTPSEQTREMLLVYFAGHGWVVGAGAYLVTAQEKRFEPGISLAELANIMETAAEVYKHVVLILDCCHSGSAFTWTNSRPLRASDVERSIATVNESRCILGACRPEQLSYEDAGNGKFTRALISGLLGDAVDYDGKVSVFGLHEYVSRSIGDDLQTPVFKGDVAGTVILGEGFEPRKGPPVTRAESAKLLAKAHQLVDEYDRLEQYKRSSTNDWLASGTKECAERLEAVRDWFQEAKRSYPEIIRDAAWTSLERRMADYRRNLSKLQVGQSIREGIVSEHLGRGGYGDVWKVVSDNNDELAYKVFHGDDLDDLAKATRFKRGYSSMRTLRHPHIVDVRDVTDTPYGFYMSYIPGDHLGIAYIKREEPSQVIKLLKDITEIVNYAHGWEIFHRDIKPQNIIIGIDEDAEPVPYLTDFDLAYHATHLSLTSSTSLLGGALQYAAPEQLEGTSRSDILRRPTVDVFSLGQVMYFCIVGQPPGVADYSGNQERFRRSASSMLPPQAAEKAVELYEIATRYSPDDRLPTAVDFLDRLNAIHSAIEISKDGNGAVDIDSFCRIFGEVHRGRAGYSLTTRSVSMASLSGQVAVIVRAEGMRTIKGQDGIVVEVELSVTGTLPVPGFKTGTAARVKLNQRLEKILMRYPGITRHHGSRGAYQVFLRGAVTADMEGVRYLRDAVISAVAGIESW